jgi:hypothetical protein
MSMHRAGLDEPAATYVWSNLSAPTMREGAAEGFKLFTKALEEYAVAGVLHLDHLAALAGSRLHARSKQRVARELAAAEGADERMIVDLLEDLLHRHRDEWRSFLEKLGPQSFITRLASVTP